jgi:hypothetical protein
MPKIAPSGPPAQGTVEGVGMGIDQTGQHQAPESHRTIGRRAGLDGDKDAI